MIHQVEVKLSESNMPKLNTKLQQETQGTGAERVLIFAVERKIDHLSVLFSDGVALGILSNSMFESLGPLLERYPEFFLKGVSPTHALRDRVGKISKSSDRKVRMDINVYGLRDTMKKIGDELSLKKLASNFLGVIFFLFWQPSEHNPFFLGQDNVQKLPKFS